MPFTIDAAFQEALQRNIRLSKAVRIERRDGQVFAFTDSGRDILLPAHTWDAITVPETLYHAEEGKFPKDIQQSRGLQDVDGWEFIAYLGATPLTGYVTEIDVLRQKFVGARFSLIFFARENLSWQMLRQRGKLGVGTPGDGLVTWKMNGLARPLQELVLKKTSPTSRAKWGDPELSAAFDLDGDSADGFAARVVGNASGIDATYPRRRFVLAATEGFPAGRFTNGTVEFLSGANEGYIGEVLFFDTATGRFTLKDAAPQNIAAGDSVRAQIAAPRTYEDWMTIIGDARYFAGEIAISTYEKSSEVSG